MQLRKIAATMLAAAVVGVMGFAHAADKKPSADIVQAVAGSWRSADAKARDHERHPAEALSFWGLKPGMSILEIQPGGGWWTEILAPYARANKGEFYATAADISDPGLSENARKGRNDFAAKYADAAVYGTVNLVNWGAKAAPLPANKFDFVLLARGIHGWVRQGTFETNLANVAQSLKPGGILAVEQHRAKAGQDPSVFNGYVDEAYVIKTAEKAGLKLDGKSEINANPKDTKDHPFGVWTLPPTRQSSADGKPVEASFDRAKYDAIGESDRMTLKFVKK
ncbi:MAG TPA: methyltransferase domain-containing protein [Steroidobacteraceae bacterium]|nr:methyltransferase domain-containing protein [Steroidobacteraceae bacterium]